MRMNDRNKQPFWYALYGETVTDYDEYGNYMGTYATYSNPVKAYGNISPARGTVAARQFGDELQYDRVITVGDRDTPIDEYAVLWIDTTPQLDTNGALSVDRYGQWITPYNYTVKQIARGLPPFGCTHIAVKRVNVS